MTHLVWGEEDDERGDSEAEGNGVSHGGCFQGTPVSRVDEANMLSLLRDETSPSFAARAGDER